MSGDGRDLPVDDELRSARDHAKQHGKALVRDEGGVLVMTWHPLARAVTGTDLLETRDDNRPSCGDSFVCEDVHCINCRHHGCARCGRSQGEHIDIEVNDSPLL